MSSTALATGSAAPSGFHNTGAICWFNSLLQSLITVIGTKVPADTRQVVSQFSAAVSAPTVASNISLLRAFLMECRAKGHPANFGGGQECAEEGLTLLLDALDGGSGCIDAQFRVVYTRSITCPKCNTVTELRDNAIDVKLFDRASLEGLPQQISSFTEYLRLHPSPCDAFVCPQCNETTKGLVFMERLIQANDVITVVLPKYDAKYLQWFPDKLTFVTKTGSLLTYELCAQIEHSGTQSGGHYWAIVRRDADVYTCNDASISPGSLGPTANTFIVFYRKKAP